MLHKDFDILTRKRFDKCRKTLLIKANEYAGEEERLQNFKDGAVFTHTTPAQYTLALVTKHFMSLRDYIVLHDDDITQYIVDEKIGDIINYMLLLEAVLTEEL